MYECTRVPGSHRDQKMLSNPLKLKLQAFVSCSVSWKLNLVLPQKQQVFLTTEQSFQPMRYFLLLLLFLRLLLLLLCTSVCVCACAHVHTNTTEYLQEVKRGVRSSGTKVSSNCKLHGISVGNWTGSSGRAARALAHSSPVSLRSYLFLYEMPQECILPYTEVTLFSVPFQV